MGKNDIFNKSNSNGYYRGTRKPRIWPLLLIFVLVVGVAIGVVIYKLLGEEHFTSQKPVIAEPEPTETPVEEVVVEIDPSDLVEDSNHIYAVKDYAYSTKDVRNWITSMEPYTGDKLAFLTFDDGPSPTNTGKILDVLKEKEAVATFFTIGTSLENTTDSGAIVNRILSEGHGVALHSYTHVYDKLYPGKTVDKEYVKEELDRLQDKLREVTGKENFKSHVFRYPGGHMSWKGTEEADAFLAENGIEYIDWNAMNGDSEPTSRRPKDPEALANFVQESLMYTKMKDVIVILMHDAENKGMTVESLPKIIDDLKAQGYKFAILK